MQYKYRVDKMITCNIIASVASRLARQLKTHTGYFDKIRVVITDPDNKDLINIVNRYKSFDIEIILTDFIGCDRVRNLLNPYFIQDEWAFILDDDDILSQFILDNLYNMTEDANRKGCTSLSFPFWNEIGNEQLPNLSEIFYNASGQLSVDICRKFNIIPVTRWFSQRAYKITSEINFINAQHPSEQRYSHDKCLWVPYPIIHIKALLESFYSPLWTMYSELFYGNAEYGEMETELLEALKKSNIKPNRSSIESKLREGDIDNSLKQWIWQYKDSNAANVYSWFIIYYLHFHPEELPEDFFDTRLLQIYLNYAISGVESIKIECLFCKDALKELLLKHGIFLVGRYNTKWE